MKKFLNEFKAFALKGNIIDLAVAVIIGSAFGKIVASLVNDIFMPVITLLTGGKNVSGLFVQLANNGITYASIEAAQAAGVSTLNYGLFIQTLIDFLIIALFIFLFIKAISKMHRKEAPAPAPVSRLCQFCKQPVHDAATRCSHCTSQLN
jgi:large conductance mechanosensitive channel